MAKSSVNKKSVPTRIDVRGDVSVPSSLVACGLIRTNPPHLRDCWYSQPSRSPCIGQNRVRRAFSLTSKENLTPRGDHLETAEMTSFQEYLFSGIDILLYNVLIQVPQPIINEAV